MPLIGVGSMIGNMGSMVNRDTNQSKSDRESLGGPVQIREFINPISFK